MKIQTRLKNATAPIALSIALVAQPAFAQDEDETPVVVDDESAVETADEGGAIIVTGSRIRRSEATSASPLQIIDPVLARRSGLNQAAEIVQNSPLAAGSTQITSAISANSQGVDGGPGTQSVDLRGLGAKRTLVLLNSRRAGPAGTRGEVTSFDLNVLPGALIESVEILKDGASSIYGSDAIAGVVNILTKRSTDGIELDAFVSLPQSSGGEEYTVSAAWGKEFDRGHIMFAGEYYRQNELERQDRDFLDCDYDYLFRTEDGDERVDLIDPRTREPACLGGVQWGHVWAYSASDSDNLPDFPVTLLQYSYPGDNLGNFLPPVPPASQPGDVVVPAGWYGVSYYTPNSVALTNSYHPFEQKSSVIPETERYTLFADGSFELSDGVELYAEGLFNRRRTYIDTLSQFYNFGYTDMYAPGDPDDPFPGFSGVGFPAFLSPTGILDDYDQEITVDYYRGVLGLQGDIASRIGFDVHGQYSRSDGEYKLDQILKDSINQQTARAYGYGCAGLFTPISNRECVQINWVDPRVMAGDLTPEEKAYLLDTETGKTVYEQLFVEASVNGELFELPAGWLGFAAGGVIRRDEIDDLPGHITRAPDPNNPGEFVDNAFSNDFSSGHTFGYSTTKELFGEIEIPVFRDQPFAQEFTLSAAGRLTNVKAVRGSDGASNETNGNFTYKVMANWQITDWVRVRGTYGTSFRAPALYEQFLADQVTSDRQINVDPCLRWSEGIAEGTITQRIADNCASEGIPGDHAGAGLPAEIFVGGGLGVLEPETSRAWTTSLILTPYVGPNTQVAFTVDYFDIKVDGEIGRLGAYTILYECYNSLDFPNSQFCDLFERGQDGNPLNVKSIFEKYINIDEQVNRGFDFTLRAEHDLGSAGTISLLGQATLQTKDVITTLGEADDLNGEVGDPKFVADVNLVWDVNDWTLFYGLDIIGASSNREQFLSDNGVLCNLTPEALETYQGDYCYRPWVPTVVYHNFSVTREFADRFEITAGISNLFNTRPPEVSGVTELGSSPFVSQYDWLGRRLFVNIGAKF